MIVTMDIGIGIVVCMAEAAGTFGLQVREPKPTLTNLFYVNSQKNCFRTDREIALLVFSCTVNRPSAHYGVRPSSGVCPSGGGQLQKCFQFSKIPNPKCILWHSDQSWLDKNSDHPPPFLLLFVFVFVFLLQGKLHLYVCQIWTVMQEPFL